MQLVATAEQLTSPEAECNEVYEDIWLGTRKPLAKLLYDCI